METLNTVLLAVGLSCGLLLGAFTIALVWRVQVMVQDLIVSFSRFLDWQTAFLRRSGEHQAAAELHETMTNGGDH